ncbi:aminoacylase-1-like [Homalodisca vitripennis]|uniref:aminoacylase-1-like n=1 Tax=Homalodisca vitripennis TaxID=197043 RepID=UPI001EECB7F5|nr:aminoacylase-1-like [Homalodisca vitripennis]
MELDDQAVKNFKQYLRIKSVQPDCDYGGCTEFLKSYANSLGLPVTVHEVAIKKPVVVVSWVGSHPGLRSVLLSSHMDVVPVYPEHWSRDPFGAEEDDEGNIHARGAQDMKCVGIQYLEAVRRLIMRGLKPKRSIHICFTPDEEIGSEEGMKIFVETEFFKKLNVGCMMDEGIASDDESFYLFYGERTPYSLEITCTGDKGYTYELNENTAAEKLSYVIEKFMDKRAEEYLKLKSDPNLTMGDVTTINLTVLSGGNDSNTLPQELKVVFDCRLSVNEDNEIFEQWIESVCREAGKGVSIKYNYTNDKIAPTKLNEDNPWWVALRTQFDAMGLEVCPVICPGATDARYIRNIGIPAFGFSPMNNTAIKIHENDEYLNKQVFLRGIEIYCRLIPALASI